MVNLYEVICECGNVDPDEAALATPTPDGYEVGEFVVDNAHLTHNYELGDVVG